MKRQFAWKTLIALSIGVVLIALAGSRASAFDTGPHFDITRDALAAEGFGNTAIEVAQVTNFFNDLYENEGENPFSGHASLIVELVQGSWGDREHWSQKVIDSADRMHFDSTSGIVNTEATSKEWERLVWATHNTVQERAQKRDIEGVLIALGISLHAVQDFYSHTNWVEQQGVSGKDPSSGPGWAARGNGSHPTWFDIPEDVRNQHQIYSSKGSGNQPRDHGNWRSDNNESLRNAMNKDWPGRPYYQDAHISAHIASRQWVQAVRNWVNDETIWQAAQQFNNRHGKQLDHDLKGSTEISFYSGHWQGNGEPSTPETDPGPGGSIDDLSVVLEDYFDGEDWFNDNSSKTFFRRKWEDLIVKLASSDVCPDGTPLPCAGRTPSVFSSRHFQEDLEFAMLQVNRIQEIDDIDLGPLDEGDWYSTANIGGQEYRSGLIHGYDSFNFLKKPYGPFTFIKALSKGMQFDEPITTLEIEVHTADQFLAGTTDDIYLLINNNQRFYLDKPLYDDFEQGDRDTYSLNPPPGLRVKDIEFIQIEKARDGSNAGGWKLAGIHVFVNRLSFYQNSKINRWLEDDHLTWRAPDFQKREPVSSDVPIMLRLFDDDGFLFGSDDHADIHTDHDRYDLNLLYNRGSGSYRGDLSGSGTSCDGNLSSPCGFGTSRGGDRNGGRTPGDEDKTAIDFKMQTLAVIPPPMPKPRVVFDFIEEAPSASWFSDSGSIALPWDGSDVDQNGLAKWRDNFTLEDGSQPERVLQTHPMWTSEGRIVGEFTLPGPIKAGDRFKAEVGFLAGAGGQVEFVVEAFGRTLNSTSDTSRDGVLKTIDVELAPVEGATTIQLVVKAGAASSQDWSVWKDARIERGTETFFDFIQEAPSASWFSDSGVIVLPWEGSDVDQNGVAKWRDNFTLEDGSQPERVLQTHPKWTSEGSIRGVFRLTRPTKAGDRFKAEVGFLAGGGGEVEFVVYANVRGSGPSNFEVARITDSGQDGVLRTIDVSLARVERATEIFLEVNAGDSSGQDWAVWKDARIEGF